jgi:hypothetical protein
MPKPASFHTIKRKELASGNPNGKLLKIWGKSLLMIRCRNDMPDDFG